jgi:hypothetical protein
MRLFVTPRACARVAPVGRVAHLWRSTAYKNMKSAHLLKQFAKAADGELRKANAQETSNLSRLNFPATIYELYTQYTPVETICGFVNLLSPAEMISENLGDCGPGKDVFPHGFIVFATMDGDGFCIDTRHKQNQVVLFGHEEPLDYFTAEMRDELLAEKGKIVAESFEDFLQKCLDEKLDTEPNY